MKSINKQIYDVIDPYRSIVIYADDVITSELDEYIDNILYNSIDTQMKTIRNMIDEIN